MVTVSIRDWQKQAHTSGQETARSSLSRQGRSQTWGGIGMSDWPEVASPSPDGRWIAPINGYESDALMAGKSRQTL
ncbi:hypothetical protein GCM10010937_19240 [Gluconobacter japonicus]|uniref:Uncharacterized protein n=1 Tax=Gluconobacter japonicus TaxID=376620 RepID=A0ABQ5WKV8_GLUJA|nr:hypothetical protein AA3271_1315 [Gluconobacter japonicus NBRC 3271]GLQ60121.1 hypothetical protein GCM10010937_19240 [Gluconobacter japonicus]